MDIETRLNPRILVNWPTDVRTRQGSIEVKTKDISVAGVFIISSAEPELDQRISIRLEPPRARDIFVIGTHATDSLFYSYNYLSSTTLVASKE